MSVKSVNVLSQVRKDVQNFFSACTPHIILGTGASCAVDVGFGMGALQEALGKRVLESALSKSSMRQWNKVIANLKKGRDLEYSLNAAESRELQNRILKITCDTVTSIDQKYALDICRGKVPWPAMAIVKKVFDGLSGSTDKTLEVITTNYDLLFEYACVSQRMPCVDGYCGCVVKCLDWDSALQSQKCKVSKKVRTKVQDVLEYRKHIRLYKVHGSLNWFMLNGNVVESDMLMGCNNLDLERVMITPGLAKYRKMQDFREELQTNTDEAVNRARGFLFLGYGMNDAHVERYIVKRIKEGSVPALIVTREWNKRIDDLARKTPCVTVVCGMQDPSEGTRVFGPRLGRWQEIKGKCLWNFSEFSKQLM